MQIGDLNEFETAQAKRLLDEAETIAMTYFRCLSRTNSG